MKDTFTQEEILNVFELALDHIETELLINTIMHPPLSDEQMAKMHGLEDFVKGMKKSYENAMINGQTAGKLMMLEFIKEQLQIK